MNPAEQRFRAAFQDVDASQVRYLTITFTESEREDDGSRETVMEGETGDRGKVLYSFPPDEVVSVLDKYPHVVTYRGRVTFTASFPVREIQRRSSRISSPTAALGRVNQGASGT